ncbi:MAG: FGGY family carbohydrate kinase, partial [Bacteroidota bacterium]|nr:FGGY family carbohydrate kinase [Bacteroidota bacterium]
MKTLGIDIGSSSVKAAILDIETGKCCASAQSPAKEMPITALTQGWAEQDPEMWWTHVKEAVGKVMTNVEADSVKAIGITYQMHGLVCVDKNNAPLRSSIIWCDSRAVPYGEKALETIGRTQCLQSLLNSPGNFTASKLAWVKDNEPDIFDKIDHIMLPGDYIAMKLTGEATTTVTGLSEGIMWNFAKNEPADFLLDYYGFSKSLLAPLVPHFGTQGQLKEDIAAELGLRAGTPVTYRAGDQPNNAFSLNVLNPGEVAATAGTSGV